MSQAVKQADQQPERHSSALADTLRRLDPLVPNQAVRHGRPTGAEWTNLGALVDEGLLVDALERLADHFQAGPDRSTARPGSPWPPTR